MTPLTMIEGVKMIEKQHDNCQAARTEVSTVTFRLIFSKIKLWFFIFSTKNFQFSIGIVLEFKFLMVFTIFQWRHKT